MKRKNADEWKKLFQEQKDSGLSAADFCEQNNLNPKYFSVKKRRLGENSPLFVQATLLPGEIHPNIDHAEGIRLDIWMKFTWRLVLGIRSEPICDTTPVRPLPKSIVLRYVDKASDCRSLNQKTLDGLLSS
ncbi:MAG: hypothetical protein HRU20_30910 [Pseudomonadales bacterium]|nr:hypothetical protein [Pseudomonadales bacterium]